MSLTLTCIVGSIIAARRERFLVASVLMILAGLCYRVAWFAALGLAIALVAVALPGGRSLIGRRAVWGCLGLGGVLAVSLAYQVEVGRFDAYFLLAQQVTQTPDQSLRFFCNLLVTQRTIEDQGLGALARAALSLQAAVAVALIVTSSVVGVMAWRRKTRDATMLYPALVGFVVMLGVLFAGNSAGWSRSIVLAAP